MVISPGAKDGTGGGRTHGLSRRMSSSSRRSGGSGGGGGHLLMIDGGTGVGTTAGRSRHDGGRSLLDARGRSSASANEGARAVACWSSGGVLGRGHRADQLHGGSAVVARQGVAAVLDALALDAENGVAERGGVEHGDGKLSHVGLGELDKSHGLDLAGGSLAGHVALVSTLLVVVGGTLDHVDLDDAAALGEELLQVKLASGRGQITDKDGATVTLASGQESLIAVVALVDAVLLEVERQNSVVVVRAESLYM